MGGGYEEFRCGRGISKEGGKFVVCKVGEQVCILWIFDNGLVILPLVFKSCRDVCL